MCDLVLPSSNQLDKESQQLKQMDSTRSTTSSISSSSPPPVNASSPQLNDKTAITTPAKRRRLSPPSKNLDLQEALAESSNVTGEGDTGIYDADVDDFDNEDTRDQTSSRECHQVGGEMPSEASLEEEEDQVDNRDRVSHSDNDMTAAAIAAMKGVVGLGASSLDRDLLASYYQSISAVVGRPPLGFPHGLVPGQPNQQQQRESGGNFHNPFHGLPGQQQHQQHLLNSGYLNGGSGVLSQRDQLMAQQRDFLMAAQHQFLAREALIRGQQQQQHCKSPPSLSPAGLFFPPSEHSTPGGQRARSVLPPPLGPAVSPGRQDTNMSGKRPGKFPPKSDDVPGGEEEDDLGEDEEDDEGKMEGLYDEDEESGGMIGDPGSNGGHQWTFEEQFKQLYELSDDIKRKEFLDDLFSFMQKRGTPVNRIPIMAKQVLDLYELFRLVASKGGLVEVINKKLWREITKGLNLPSSITSAAFTLRTQYMKYLYPYECETLKMSSPSELQAAIDGNRREARRPSYSFEYPMMLGSGGPPGMGSQVCGGIPNMPGHTQVSQGGPPVSLSALFAAHCQNPHGFPGIPGLSPGMAMHPGRPLTAGGMINRNHNSAMKDLGKSGGQHKNGPENDRLSSHSPGSSTASDTPLSPNLIHSSSGFANPKSLSNCVPPTSLVTPSIHPSFLGFGSPTSHLFTDFPSSLFHPTGPPLPNSSPATLSPMTNNNQRTSNNNNNNLKRRHSSNNNNTTTSQSETSPGSTGSTAWEDQQQKEKSDVKPLQLSVSGGVQPQLTGPVMSGHLGGVNNQMMAPSLNLPMVSTAGPGGQRSTPGFFSPPSFPALSFSNPHLRMSTQPGPQVGMPDNTLVVSMDMNGMVYQGVLFVQPKRF